jgi:hypothetical protein
MPSLIERLTKWLQGPAAASTAQGSNPAQTQAASTLLVGETEVAEETTEEAEGSKADD